MNKHQIQRILYFSAYYISFLTLGAFHDVGAILLTAIILGSWILISKSWEKELEEKTERDIKRLKKHLKKH